MHTLLVLCSGCELCSANAAMSSGCATAGSKGKGGTGFQGLAATLKEAQQRMTCLLLGQRCKMRLPLLFQHCCMCLLLLGKPDSSPG